MNILIGTHAHSHTHDACTEMANALGQMSCGHVHSQGEAPYQALHDTSHMMLYCSCNDPMKCEHVSGELGKDWVLPLQSYQQISCGCGQLNACASNLHIIIILCKHT